MNKEELVIGLAGPIGSGKTTIARLLVDECRLMPYSWASPMRKMLVSLMVHNGAHTQEAMTWLTEHKNKPCPYLHGNTPRKALRTLGTEWGRECMGSDFWSESINYSYGKWNRGVVVDDVRFINEVEKIDSMGGKVFWLTGRGDEDQISSHPSDVSLLPENCHASVSNTGTPMETMGLILTQMRRG